MSQTHSSTARSVARSRHIQDAAAPAPFSSFPRQLLTRGATGSSIALDPYPNGPGITYNNSAARGQVVPQPRSLYNPAWHVVYSPSGRNLAEDWANVEANIELRGYEDVMRWMDSLMTTPQDTLTHISQYDQCVPSLRGARPLNSFGRSQAVFTQNGSLTTYSFGAGPVVSSIVVNPTTYS